jgi:decaprenylphospho-beta-D-ribofuranose 2-oxidase
MAFDTHALSTGMVIQLEGFDAIGDVTPSGTITVGAHAPWGAILEATRRAGYVPYAMASTERATAGGTLSADCLSRFSPTCGKEGNHVARVSVLTADGQVLECSRDHNAALFRGVISGFGCVGVVLEVTYELLHVGFSDVVVATTFAEFSGLDGLAQALVTKVEGAATATALAGPPDGDLRLRRKVAASDMQAISAVAYLQGEARGFVMHSTYVDGASHPLNPSPLHQPQSLIQQSLQALAFFEVARVVGYGYLLDVYLPEHADAVDPLADFTFFQGGNDAVIRHGRALGFAMGIRQQTWIVPMTPGDPDANSQRLARFLTETQALLERHDLLPPLIDVLFLPDDSGEGFALSSNRAGPGYAVTLTFEAPLRSDFPDEEQACVAISQLCASMGGRVHLVKNVFADAPAIATMYAAGIAELKALRAKHDPSGTLSSAFLERVAPALFDR